MTNQVIDQTFDNQSFNNIKLPAREYDNCTFINCDFTETNMSAVTFLECTFDTCNFSLVMMKETSFQEVLFTTCKMLGFDFSNCNDFMFSAKFYSTNLEYSSFYGFKMKNTLFSDCNLCEADFTKTDLTGSVFDDCNLSKAIFDKTILESVDFKTAENFSIDPETNKLKKAKFSKSGLAGLLIKHNLVIE